MRLYSLGRSEIEVDGARLTPDAERLFALAVYLVAARGRPVPRSELTQLLWPEVPERQAAHSLRQALYRLRHLNAPIVTSRTSLHLPSESVWADYFGLLDPRGDDEPPPSGAFLPGYDPKFSDRLRTWIEQQRSIVHSALRRRQVHAISMGRQRGDWALVERIAHACLEIDCLNEEATFALAEAAVMHGSKTRGLQILDHYLKEIGPGAREMRIPAVTLRNRIARSELSSFNAGRTVPFVGRREYLERLNSALALAANSHGSFQFIWGEPGIGKTRLVREFIDAAKLQDVQVVVANVQSSDQSRPLSCFLDLLPVLLSLPGSLGCSPSTLQILQELAGRSPAPPIAAEVDPRAISARNRSAILELLDCIAEEQKVVLVVEDLHWVDALSQELLQDLSNWVTSRALLLVTTSRSRDVLEMWKRLGLYAIAELELLPLSDLESRLLLNSLRSMSRIRIASEEEVSYISASGGNPYHLTELVLRSVHEGDNYYFEPSLSALIRKRFDRLRPESIRVLQTCAILGKHASLGRLREILQLRSGEFLDALDELERQGLLEVSTEGLRCKHDLVASVAISQMGHASRRLLHFSVARVLDQEREESAVAPSLLWDAAEHWLGAGENQRAIARLRDCAARARHLGSPIEAGRVLRRALELPQDVGSKLEVLQDYAHALEHGSEWTALLSALEEIRRLREAQGRAATHDDQELSLYEAKRRCGTDPAELLNDLKRCISPLHSPEHRIRAGITMFKICDNACDRRTAVETFNVISDALRSGEVAPEARLECELIFECSFGDVARAGEVARHLIERTEGRVEADNLRMRALWYGAIALSYAGYVDEARRRALEAFEQAAIHEINHMAGAAAYEIAFIEFARGDVSEAKRWVAEAIRWGRKTPVAFGLTAALMMNVSIALASGDYADAQRVMVELEQERVVHSYARARAWLLGFRLTLAWKIQGRSPSPLEIRELLEQFEVARQFVGIDFVALMVHDLLCAAGRSDEGRRVLEEYITVHRRDRSPLPSALRSAMSRQ